MAVELVIKIPDEKYDGLIKQMQLDRNFRTCKITPLPKGHGNLIDTKEFIKAINDWADNIDNYGAYEELEIAKALLQNHAHTIIEADKS